MTAVLPDAASVEERQALRTAVAGVLADHCSEAAVRAAMATPEGYDPKLWAHLAQLGVQGLAVDVTHGGAGSSFEEVAIVLEEMGRALYPGPFLATTLAVMALNACDDDAVRDRYLPLLATGDLIATVAVEQPTRGASPAPQVRVTAGTLKGFVPHVLDGHLAKLLLVAARDEQGVGLYAVEPGAAGVSAALLTTTDQTRRLARVTFDGAPAQRIGGARLVAYVLSVGAAAVAAEQAGGAEAVLTSAVAYAKVRTQFGRAIGSFQAIKHHCSDLFLGSESAKAAARRAAQEVAADGPELAELAAVAKAFCSDAYSAGAATSLQIHGGIGFTWEHSAHLHLKRAKTDELLFGDARHHRARLADALGV